MHGGVADLCGTLDGGVDGFAQGLQAVEIARGRGSAHYDAVGGDIHRVGVGARVGEVLAEHYHIFARLRAGSDVGDVADIAGEKFGIFEQCRVAGLLNHYFSGIGEGEH